MNLFLSNKSPFEGAVFVSTKHKSTFKSESALVPKTICASIMFRTSILSALPLFLSTFLTSLLTLQALPSNLELRQDNVICGKVNPTARTCIVSGHVLRSEGAMTITVNVKDSDGNVIGTGSSPYPLTLGADYNYPGPSVTGDAFACDMNSTLNMVCTWHGLPTFQSPICGLGFVGI